MADGEKELLLVPPATKVSHRERAQRRWVTVEPVIAMAVVGHITIGLLRPFYLKSRLGESLYNITSPEEFSKCRANNSDGGLMEDEIQSQASLWLLYLGAVSNVPIMISSIVLGSMSDRIGRKICMALPVIGYICQEIVYFVTVYLHLPLPTLFAGEFLQGVTGGFGLLFAGCISYLSDVSSEKQRTLRIAVAEMLMYFVGGMTQIGAGFLIHEFSPLPPLVMSFGFNVLCLLYVAIPCLLLETVERDTIPAHRKGLGEVARSVSRLLKYNENGRRWQMLLLDFFFFFMMVNVYGAMAIFVLYGTAKPFCWSAVIAGLAGSFGFITASLGMVFGTKLFSLCLGEYWIMQISCLSMFLFNIVMAVAQSTLVIFVANTLGALRGMAVPVSRSILSKITAPEEIGAAFAIVACLDSLSGFVSNLVAPSIYAATVWFLPPLIFYVYAGLGIVPAAIVLILQIFWPRRKDKKLIRRSSYEEYQNGGMESDTTT